MGEGTGTIGQPDYMKTDASALLIAAETWRVATDELPDRSDNQIAMYICTRSARDTWPQWLRCSGSGRTSCT